MAAGFCGAGTAAAGGVGKKIADLVLDGERIAWHDPVDVKRFVDLHNNIKYLRDRVQEVVGKSEAARDNMWQRHIQNLQQQETLCIFCVTQRQQQ